jgi:multiple antibiotic resistance protein
MLTALILQVGQHGYWITTGALILNYLVAWLLLKNCDAVQRVMGKEGTVIASKIAALLLAAIAVSMIRYGFFEAVAAFRAV